MKCYANYRNKPLHWSSNLVKPFDQQTLWRNKEWETGFAGPEQFSDDATPICTFCAVSLNSIFAESFLGRILGIEAVKRGYVKDGRA